MKKILILVFGMVFLSGCAVQQDETVANVDEFMREKAINLRTQLCEEQTIDLSDGPCLSDEIVRGWVCDVAHEPREAVDDLPENQCEAYREGRADHFVEVDANCGFIDAF